jgi:hypothetical protein
MTLYVWHEGQWYPVGRHVPAPRVHIIGDHMDATKHMADGRTYDSKSAFRAATRAAGCVELGNDAPVGAPPPDVNRAELRNDIRTAFEQLEQGYRPPSAGTVSGKVRMYGDE